MVTFRAIGDWPEGGVSVARHEDTRWRVPALEAGIERAWLVAGARLGARLFDGPMCRLERLDITGDALRLWVSPTSYKPFLGTNLTNRQAPPEALANPLGLSAALSTADGWLMLGRRNASVAYYPDRIHPFAGSLEPTEIANVFDGVRRELAEELRFGPADIAAMRCIGLVEDPILRQPELVFAVRSTRSRAQVEAMLDAAEHCACVAVEQTGEAVEKQLRDPVLTPVCAGTLMLWGRLVLGEKWFAQQRG